MIDSHGIVSKFLYEYVEALDLARNDSDSTMWVQRDADRTIREMRKVVNAVNIIQQYGLKVS